MKDQALYSLLQVLPVQPGTFLMGSPEDEPERNNDEVQRKVTLSRSFELGKFPVTNLIWTLVTGERLEGEPLLPKSEVSWNGAVEFCRRLNELVGLPQAMTQGARGEWILDLDSPGFRLPTEAEWEYCCRAGTTEAAYGPLDDIAWHFRNSGGSTKPVGLKLPNQWGFYDTLGNVSEWCWDWFDSQPSQALDPAGPATGSNRVLRGGSWINFTSFVRAARRSLNAPGKYSNIYGFRLAKTCKF